MHWEVEFEDEYGNVGYLVTWGINKDDAERVALELGYHNPICTGQAQVVIPYDENGEMDLENIIDYFAIDNN